MLTSSYRNIQKCLEVWYYVYIEIFASTDGLKLHIPVCDDFFSTLHLRLVFVLFRSVNVNLLQFCQK